MTTITGADVGQADIDWPSALGWQVVQGAGHPSGYTPEPERLDYDQVVVSERRLRDALAEQNPSQAAALNDACGTPS